MLDESTTVYQTVHLCLSHVAQVRVQKSTELKSLGSLPAYDAAVEGRTPLKRHSRRRAEPLVQRRTSRAVRIVELVSHASRGLQVVGVPMAGPALPGRLFACIYLQRAIARLNRSIIPWSPRR